MSAAILLSGGIDSTAVTFWKKPAVAITIDYGQAPADAEIRASEVIASDLDIPHVVVRMGMHGFGSGVMAGAEQIKESPSPEWWPFRNQLLVTVAAIVAIRRDCRTLLIGTVSSDKLHADGRVDFVRRLDSLLQHQEGGLRLLAPAIDMSSIELIKASHLPDSLLAWCHSCHTGNSACGNCRGCLKSYATKQNRPALRDALAAE